MYGGPAISIPRARIRTRLPVVALLEEADVRVVLGAHGERDGLLGAERRAEEVVLEPRVITPAQPGGPKIGNIH